LFEEESLDLGVNLIAFEVFREKRVVEELGDCLLQMPVQLLQHFATVLGGEVNSKDMN
jgi:hypothetical protein